MRCRAVGAQIVLAAKSWAGYAGGIWDSQAMRCLAMVSKWGGDSILPKRWWAVLWVSTQGRSSLEEAGAGTWGCQQCLGLLLLGAGTLIKWWFVSMCLWVDLDWKGMEWGCVEGDALEKQSCVQVYGYLGGSCLQQIQILLMVCEGCEIIKQQDLGMHEGQGLSPGCFLSWGYADTWTTAVVWLFHNEGYVDFYGERKTRGLSGFGGDGNVPGGETQQLRAHGCVSGAPASAAFLKALFPSLWWHSAPWLWAQNAWRAAQRRTGTAWAGGIRVQVNRAQSLRVTGVCGLLTAQGWAQQCPGGGCALICGLWFLQPGHLCWLCLASGPGPFHPKRTATEQFPSRMLKNSLAFSRQKRAWLSFWGNYVLRELRGNAVAWKTCGAFELCCRNMCHWVYCCVPFGLSSSSCCSARESTETSWEYHGLNWNSSNTKAPKPQGCLGQQALKKGKQDG